MIDTNDMRSEFEAWYYEIENVSMRCERLHDLSIRRDSFFAAWQAATERATVLQWQDIATAPRDGSPILVYHNRMILETWYSTKWERFVVSETGGTNGIKPTHWMPLPPPPVIQKGSAT